MEVVMTHPHPFYTCPTCSGRGYHELPATRGEPPCERDCAACDGTGVELPEPALEECECGTWGCEVDHDQERLAMDHRPHRFVRDTHGARGCECCGLDPEYHHGGAL